MDAKIARDKTVAFLRRFWPAILAVSAIGGVGLYLESWMDVRGTVSNRKVTTGTVKRLNKQLRIMRDKLHDIAHRSNVAPVDTSKPSALGPVKPNSKSVRYVATDFERRASIARSPSEVIELQKQGDRDYEVFQLSRSKWFRSVGPIRVSLKKADPASQLYDLELKTHKTKIVKSGVKRLERINVQLDGQQNVELVVNQINDDQVVGYVGVPKGLEANASLN
jgi:hypothetical protein